VSWTQNKALRLPNQVGDLEDGTFFRRIRPLWDGTAWDTVEWNVILALEQVQGSFSNVNPTPTPPPRSAARSTPTSTWTRCGRASTASRSSAGFVPVT
jgi:hypothetical protein